MINYRREMFLREFYEKSLSKITIDALVNMKKSFDAMNVPESGRTVLISEEAADALSKEFPGFGEIRSFIGMDIHTK